MEATGEPKKRRKRKRPRTPVERSLSWPYCYPFITSFFIIPGCIVGLVAMINLVTGAKPWPPEYGSVDLCIVYVNADGHMRAIDSAPGQSFAALQESLLSRIAENSTFVLPAARQGETALSFGGHFKFKILSPEGYEPQRIRARCEHDNGTLVITTYDVSSDLLLPKSSFTGTSPSKVAYWTYLFTLLVLFPVLFIGGRRTRRRMKRRTKRDREERIDVPEALQIEIEAEDQARMSKKKRRRRRREASS